MDFSIDIHSTLNGEIIIEDFSKDYNQYIDEDVEINLIIKMCVRVQLCPTLCNSIHGL